jgi:hypothetical protein
MSILLSIPIVIGAHHFFLIAVWNASLTVFFLPGRPRLWMLATLVTLMLACVNRLLDRERRFIHVPSMTWILAALAVVVVVTYHPANWRRGAPISGGRSVWREKVC